MIIYRAMTSKKRKRLLSSCFLPRKSIMKDGVPASGIGKASVYHALVVIFLEFFAWGLLTSPTITVLNNTFPDHQFLMNGLIQGIKGILSFLSAPLIGSLSDILGRKPFLLLTVAFTCAPIPIMRISPWWYFAMISISGVFSVTFSVVFAYVADVTEEQDRSAAYGLVSATFAASLVTSPAIGAYLGDLYSENVVVAVACAVAALDVFFIMVAVPESLPASAVKQSSSLAWEHIDPIASLRHMSKDPVMLMLCGTVFLSYLPEAGQYSCFFVYLRLVMGFSAEEVAAFIAVVGILSVIAQTAILSNMIRCVGNKHTIIVGLLFQIVQLMWYGFGAKVWMMWAAGCLAAMSSITYPAISAFVSVHADSTQQGAVQGMITGVRGLCNGLGPALYGLVFYKFHVDLNGAGLGAGAGPDGAGAVDAGAAMARNLTAGHHLHHHHLHPHHPAPAVMERILPGPPFALGACFAMMALLIATVIPEDVRAAAASKMAAVLRSPSSTSPSTSKDSLMRSKKSEVRPLLLSHQDL